MSKLNTGRGVRSKNVSSHFEETADKKITRDRKDEIGSNSQVNDSFNNDYTESEYDYYTDAEQNYEHPDEEEEREPEYYYYYY